MPLCFSASGALSTLPDNYSTSGMDHGAHGRHAFEMLLVGRACTVKLRGPTPRSFVGAFVVPGARPVVPPLTSPLPHLILMPTLVYRSERKTLCVMM